MAARALRALAAAAGAWIFIASASAATEPRYALVIGNGRYAGAPLANATNDATAVAKVLEKAGFEVDLKIDASQKQMQDAIAGLGQRLRGDAVGLFYFAGHGVQVKGRNYLVPVGSDIRKEGDIQARTVDVQQMLDRMGSARNRMNLVILDACRDNPFSADGKSGSGGLSQLDAPTGSLIAFATAPGSVASDGKGANGLYTQHLLANIERPGTPVEEVFKRVRLGVRVDSNGRQIPWESTSLDADFYFFPGSGGKGLAGGATLPPPPGIEQIARAELGYDLLRQGKADAAEREFRALAQSSNAEVALMGREGLAETMLAKGNVLGAIAEANDIIAKAPARSAPYLIRGRALAASGKVQEGAASFQTAAAPTTSADFAWQKAGALVAVGNAQRKEDPKVAAKTYERAVKEDPKNLTALGNLAVALNEAGDPQRSRQVLEKALAIDPNDAMAAALMRQIRDSIAERDDLARQRAVDETVKELAARMRQPAPKGAPPADDWTSPVMAITVLPFQDQSLGAVAGRIGADALLQQAVIEALQARGFAVVERRLLDKLVAEIKLGSSELADQDTQIRLGRVFAARMMVAGQLVGDASGTAVSVRAIDTESTRLALARSERADEPMKIDRVAAAIADAIAKTVKERYPLKGRVVQMDGQRAIINLGKKHGVTLGQSFNVLGAAEPIEFNGRVIGSRDKQVAQVTVAEVDEQIAVVRIDTPGAVLARQQRIVARAE